MIAAGDVTRIRVTAEDIAEGMPQDDCECPIALALLRALGDNPPSIEVLNDQINATVSREDEGDLYFEGLTADLPSFARLFIHRFDVEGPATVEPFELEIVWRAAS